MPYFVRIQGPATRSAARISVACARAIVSREATCSRASRPLGFGLERVRRRAQRWIRRPGHARVARSRRHLSTWTVIGAPREPVSSSSRMPVVHLGLYPWRSAWYLRVGPGWSIRTVWKREPSWSANDTCAQGWRRSRRTISLDPLGQPDNSTLSVSWRNKIRLIYRRCESSIRPKLRVPETDRRAFTREDSGSMPGREYSRSTRTSPHTSLRRRVASGASER